MSKDEKARLRWVLMYEELQDAGLVCRRCGISRPTLRKWVKRFKESGPDGLKDRSRCPKTSPNLRVTEQETKWILDFRRTRKLGARRIQNELKRQHNWMVSLATIHKVLTKHNCAPLQRPRRKPKDYIRYSRPVPGDRVQMDTCKIAAGLYQYTAIDDCSRWMVLGLYKRRSAASTLEFLEKVCEEMPFAIQRFQTDRGKEFFADKVQKQLMNWAIKFRPVKPASPHLNGKVERAQKTVLYEFYSEADLNAPELLMRLEEWQFYYNWHRPHGSLNGKSPIDVVCELKEKIPFGEDVERLYNPAKERLQESNYRLDLELRKLKRCP